MYIYTMHHMYACILLYFQFYQLIHDTSSLCTHSSRIHHLSINISQLQITCLISSKLVVYFSNKQINVYIVSTKYGIKTLD